MHNHFLEALTFLQTLPYTDKEALARNIEHVKTHDKLVRDEGISDHFCAFFLPFDPEKKEVFFGHHKKAGTWIPPGGHIDQGEKPIETAVREFREELQHTITTEKVDLIDFMDHPIQKINHPCTHHRNFLFVVHIPKQDFQYDTREFYEAKWVKVEDIIQYDELPAYHKLFKRIIPILNK